MTDPREIASESPRQSTTHKRRKSAAEGCESSVESTGPDPCEIAVALTKGERAHVMRLACAGPEGLRRRAGWKARAVMMKGLSDWVSWRDGTEALSPLGLAVRAVLVEGERR